MQRGGYGGNQSDDKGGWLGVDEFDFLSSQCLQLGRIDLSSGPNLHFFAGGYEKILAITKDDLTFFCNSGMTFPFIMIGWESVVAFHKCEGRNGAQPSIPGEQAIQ